MLSLFFCFLFAGAAYCATPVLIDFFYEPGCHDCERIEAEILPEIESRFGSNCLVQPHDLDIKTNFMNLLQLEDLTEYTESERAYLVVNRQTAFGARPDTQALYSLIATLLDTDAPTAAKPGNTTETSLQERFAGFTIPAVVAAGILDGINPCAISTLIFFMSLLAVSKVRNRQLLLLGTSFCCASFLTYLALGFGLFRALHLLSGFTVFRRILEWIMGAVLLLLAFLSLRDAVRFHRTGKGGDVTLQLSSQMKKRIHRVMRRGLKPGHLVLGGLFIGILVTALESVCTGQVYVPTLILILKDNALAEGRAWQLLLLYNTMFILPIVLVFIAVYFGLRTDTLLAWSRRNVVVSKSLLGLFFIAMALLIFQF